MAKKPVLTAEQKIERSLAKASKTLNQLLNIDTKAALAEGTGIAPFRFTFYQVWCPDEKKTIGNPTDDIDVARDIRDDHNKATSHVARILEG